MRRGLLKVTPSTAVYNKTKCKLEVSGFKYDLQMEYDVTFEYKNNKSVTVYTEDV